jgi:polyisoprenoid-binding protein YceI
MTKTIVSTFVLAAGLLPAANYAIDSAHSAAQFKVRHLMVSNVRGDFSHLSGKLEFDLKNPESSRVEATIDVATVDTREPDRDKHLRSADFFDAGKYPQMIFKSKKFIASGPNSYQVVGDLTIRGVTREVTFKVDNVTPETKGMMGETRIGAQVSGTVNRKDFGVSWNKSLDGGGVVVGDDVEITLDIEAIRK